MNENLTSERNNKLPEIQRQAKKFQTRNDNQLKNLDFNSINDIRNLRRGKSNIYKFKKSKFNSLINLSITDLKKRKTFIKKNTRMLKSDNDIKIHLEKINEVEESHKTKISNLLNNARNFFNNLGNYLEENKPKEIPYLNAEKIYKKLSTVKKKDLTFSKVMKEKESDINKLYGRMFSKKILNDDNEINLLNKPKTYIINKSISNNNNIEEKEQINNNIIIKNNNNIDNNNDNNNQNIVKIIKQKKSYSDQIIQTLNENDEKIYNDNNKNNISSKGNNEKENLEDNKHNIKSDKVFIINQKKKILPLVTFHKYRKKFDSGKNDIKIAEIREIFPCYPYNRIININNNNRTNRKKNINIKLYDDLKNNIVSDSRYYYEKFLKDIKLGNNDNDFYSNYYTSKREHGKTNKISTVYIQLKDKKRTNPEF